MVSSSVVVLLTLVTSSCSVLAQDKPKPSFPIGALPNQTETGQSGYNICGTKDSQNSLCQTGYLNSVDDFCLWAPAVPQGVIGETEREEVAWCTKPGHGARLIPDGTITGAHFVQTKDYVQITGIGDLTKINIQTGDAGGELDPHGADGNGNPIGGLLYGNSFGTVQQYLEWTNFMSSTQFCIRACIGNNAAIQCNHIYDLMGCDWNMPGNYQPGVFESCQGENDAPMGHYPQPDGSTSTWFQGISPTPPPQPAAPSSSCKTLPTISNGFTPTTGGPSPTSAPLALGGISPSPTARPGTNSTQNGTPSSAGSIAGLLPASAFQIIFIFAILVSFALG